MGFLVFTQSEEMVKFSWIWLYQCRHFLCQEVFKNRDLCMDMIRKVTLLTCHVTHFCKMGQGYSSFVNFVNIRLMITRIEVFLDYVNVRIF